MAGRLRVDMEPLAEFPFIGNTSIAFHSVPTLDMSISSFGGVDLSILPGMHSWINVTLSWVLTQLAHPNYITVDMQPIICPSCGSVSKVRRHRTHDGHLCFVQYNALLYSTVISSIDLWTSLKQFTTSLQVDGSVLQNMGSLAGFVGDVGNGIKRVIVDMVAGSVIRSVQKIVKIVAEKASSVVTESASEGECVCEGNCTDSCQNVSSASAHSIDSYVNASSERAYSSPHTFTKDQITGNISCEDNNGFYKLLSFILPEFLSRPSRKCEGTSHEIVLN